MGETDLILGPEGAEGERLGPGGRAEGGSLTSIEKRSHSEITEDGGPGGGYDDTIKRGKKA